MAQSVFSGLSIINFDARIVTTSPHFGLPSGPFMFDITGTNGLTAVVESATNLSQPNWLPLQTNTLDTGPAHFSDSATHATSFFRLSPP